METINRERTSMTEQARGSPTENTDAGRSSSVGKGVTTEGPGHLKMTGSCSTNDSQTLNPKAT